MENLDKVEILKITMDRVEEDITDEEILHLILEKKISSNAHEETEYNFGQRAADTLAKFAGSWVFVISFSVILIIWILFNNYLGNKAFDPFPFILLNLILSCIAAIQAPLIMMSQNRASDYDRLQAKNDYNVNKVSEEGIRLLHTKLDHLVQQDQSDLLEIQKLQTEMLASITEQVVELQKQNKDLLEEMNALKQTQN